MDSSEDDKDELAALDGLSLSEAFKAFVLGAPDVQSSFEGTKAKFPKFEPTLKVILPLISGRKWPLSFDAEVFARNLCAPKRKLDPYKIGAGPAMTDGLPIEMQAAMTAIFARYNELTELLRNGSVVAWGASEAGDNRKAIDSSYWDSTKLAIDIMEGELGQVEAKNWRAKFEVIELHLPTARIIDAEASAEAVVSKSRAGAKASITGDDAFWLKTRVYGVLDKNGLPRSQRNLEEIVQEAWASINGEADRIGRYAAQTFIRDHLPDVFERIK